MTNPLTPKWHEKYRCIVSRSGQKFLIDIDNVGPIFTAKKNSGRLLSTAFETPDGCIVIDNQTNGIVGILDKMGCIEIPATSIRTDDCLVTPPADNVVNNKVNCEIASVDIPATERHCIQTDDCFTTPDTSPPEEGVTDSRLEQLVKELNLQTTKLAGQKEQLLGVGISKDYRFADLKEGSSTALLLVNSLSSKLSEIKKSLEADQEFIDEAEQFCEFSRVELLKRLFLNSQVINNLQKTNKDALEDLRQRERDYNDLLYRFKFLAKVFAKILNEELEDGRSSAKRLDPIFDDENFNWKEVEYRLFKMVEYNLGIDASPRFPIKEDWKVKPRRS